MNRTHERPTACWGDRPTKCGLLGRQATKGKRREDGHVTRTADGGRTSLTF
ncbi:hypothetical protein ACFQH2_06890 [Natronoarchaeum sp. GCM10025703]|uniref:hypothetical protein n=1 Tax=Natronoarchaeum sp. GCM10025703 TaxID=3252685 RepID=UPI0036099231